MMQKIEAAHGGLASAIARAVKDAGEVVTVLVRREKVRRELERMDDRMLLDIGITRGEIDALVSRCAPLPGRLTLTRMVEPVVISARSSARH